MPEEAAAVLTGLARAAIEHGVRLRRDAPVTDEPAWLRQAGAAFVTLTIERRLRGCIGSLIAHRPLGQDVAANARAAAFDDPRFPPVRSGEVSRLAIEVSVLGVPEPMSFSGRDDALRQLRPGLDGVILAAGGRRATFLPQVWDELPQPERFLAHLLAKAGLPPDYWNETVRLQRYTVTAYTEPE